MSDILMQILQPFCTISTALFVLTLGFYAITCFQWFSYRVERVLFHFTRPLWHVVFFVIPLVLFYLVGKWFFIYFYFGLLPAMFVWYKRLDKPLVFTARVKRFFIILLLALAVQNLLYFIADRVNHDVISPIIVAFILSHFLEKFNAYRFEKKAIEKLKKFENLKIVLITASYGKTSIKNYLFEFLKGDFNVHKTPRSVNTLVGLIKDVNENLTPSTQIYIAEAGARLSGDIAEISAFLKPQIVIVGQIGEQHIEYFKSLENIRATKLEALQSERLEQAFLHSSTLKTADEKTQIYDSTLSDVVASLDGLNFSLDGREYHSSLLGGFNAANLAACIKTASYLGVLSERIQTALKGIKNAEHRLERIDAGGKIIIDDSFNGNFAGMSASYELVKSHPGRKVLITPGIVEATAQDNENLSRIINEIFDVVMISSPLNAQALMKYLTRPQIVIIKDKSKMQEQLLQHTRAGDLVLFSNDAPSFM